MSDQAPKDALEEDNMDLKKATVTEDFETDLQSSVSAFEALERDFQEVLAELMGDQSLEKFRLEYEKLHRALKKSHDQEKRLVKKCRELNSEIVNNQAKIKTALRLSQEDQKTITHLQKEMEKTWKLVSQSQEKETRAKDTIQHLKEEMTNLSKLVERGAGISMTQENLVKELKQAKDELQRQVEEQASQLQILDGQLMSQHKVQEDLIAERDAVQSVVNEVRDKLTQKETEHVRETKRREKTQKELMDVRVKMDENLKVEEKVRAELATSKGANTDLDRQLSDAKATMEKYLRDYDGLLAKTAKITEDLDGQIMRNKQMHADLQIAEKEMKLKNAEIGRLNTDKAALERRVDKEHREAIAYRQMADDAKTPLLVAQAEIEMLKRDLIDAQKQENQLAKNNDRLAREREVQSRATVRAEQKAKETGDELNQQGRNVDALTQEIQDFKEETQRLRKAIYQLERDRERLSNELGDSRAGALRVHEELKLKETQVDDLEKRIVDWESKMRQQQQLYETVRSDRNHYSKNLIESQDEITELKKKTKITNHQIEQLKEELAAKDQALVKEHFELQRAETLKESALAELSSKNQVVRKDEDLLRQQEIELKKLTASIRRMDEEALAQRKEYDQVINERDILGTQLIRRNDELALLYEKLRVQQSALRAGESQYATRVDDIRVLKQRVRELSREIELSAGTSNKADDMRREVLHLQKELLQEKTKVTALSEELENPMNVHRWRKLEGSDPATFELIQKIQTLQRRLISKTEEVVEKGLIIQEKEEAFQKLKDQMKRQPGPEVAEQLTTYQRELKSKTRQLKAMASELNMCQAQVNEYKYEMERINRELQEVRRKYYAQKRKDQLLREMEQSTVPVPGLDSSSGARLMSKTAPQLLQNEQILAAKSARTRYTGGGFAIK